MSDVDKSMASALIWTFYTFALAATGRRAKVVVAPPVGFDARVDDPDDLDLPDGVVLGSIRHATQDELRRIIDALRKDLAASNFDGLKARCERLLSNRPRVPK